MKRVVILSDTHGLLRPQVLEHLSLADVVIHGGDINTQAIVDTLSGYAPLHIVRGNNDKEWAEHLPLSLTFSIEGVHFFLDDYQFFRCWRDPERYTKLLSGFGCVLAPDFSTYVDMPMAAQIYSHYRKHWLGAYWQMHGIRVIPTISWSTPESYEWCFTGEPVGGVVAVSSVGCLRDKEATRRFLQGYDEMARRLDPSWVVFYGLVPRECDWNVIRIPPHQDKIAERRKRKWAAEEAAADSEK